MAAHGVNMEPLFSPRNIEEFWIRVRLGMPDECWEWTDHRVAKYGQYWCRDSQKKVRAHRFSVELSTGTRIKPGLVVRHSCDNPICVNPRHLIVGTQAENMRDMAERGRRKGIPNPYPGERSPNAKLTMEQVREIRSKHLAGSTRKELEDEYGLTRTLVANVVTHATYREKEPHGS